MKVTLNPFKQKRSRRWWTISIVAHTIVALLLAQIVFRYPLGQLLGIPKERIQQERLHYIALPKPAGTDGGAATPSAAQPAAPAPLKAPAVTPSTITNPPVLDSVRSRAAGATGTGLSDLGSGLATGVAPRMPDSRISLVPGDLAAVPRTVSESVDSVISLAIGIVNDSLAIAAGQRKPGDWTKTDKNGRVWGWDQQGNIRLGKFVIPGPLLALLPLNVQSATSPIEQRAVAWIRQDIQYHAQRAITEDEFRASVKRIRERKERERRQKMLAASGRDSTAQ
jgi:hypothetical protein